MLTNNPLVSIIIPVYNGSNFLENAIRCALDQDYSNLEIIVVNDGSNDNGKTEKIARSFGDKIRYYYKENGGVSSALNYGISVMRGDYFSWLSHDDSYSSSKISDAIDILNSQKKIGTRCVAFTDGYFISSSGKCIRKFKQFFKHSGYYSGLEVIKAMTSKGTLNGCCMTIPRSAFEEIGYFDESLRYSQDALMWYRLFLSGYGLVVDHKENVMYRLHDKQTSQLRRDLYEHDSQIIAKELAPLLLKADATGHILYDYMIRLTKHRCQAAFQYLKQYAVDHNALSTGLCFRLNFFVFFGGLRYYSVRTLKRFLLHS